MTQYLIFFSVKLILKTFDHECQTVFWFDCLYLKRLSAAQARFWRAWFTNLKIILLKFSCLFENLWMLAFKWVIFCEIWSTIVDFTILLKNFTLKRTPCIIKSILLSNISKIRELWMKTVEVCYNVKTSNFIA